VSLVAPRATTRGRVVAFDDHRGLGEVEDHEGRRVRFHCTAIADGTRTIPVGTDVVFRMVTGPIGTVEAAELRPA
jgi:cold shock CspA family protein